MDFEAAKKHVGPRPWLIDNVDSWLERMSGPPHNCCCVFIDNSGADFLLGVVFSQFYFLDHFLHFFLSGPYGGGDAEAGDQGHPLRQHEAHPQ